MKPPATPPSLREFLPASRFIVTVPSFLRFCRTALSKARGALLAAAALLAFPAGAQTLYLLTTDGKLATAPTANPAAATTPIAITGVNAQETLVAIDVRPQNQKLYALGVNATADTATLYLLSTEKAGTVFASAVSINGISSTITYTTNGSTVVDFPDSATTNWDIDFNPAADRLRVVTSSGLNFRINPNTGGPVDGDNGGAAGSVTGTNPDGAINGGTTTVSATAYTNSQPNNGNITTQYTVDAATNALFIQNLPNSGTQTLGSTITLGGSTLDFSEASFDIKPGINASSSNAAVTFGTGFLVAKVGGTTGVYSLNLVTAQATLLGTTALSVRSSALRTDLGAALALTSDGTTLVRFNPAAPGTTTTVGVTGVTAGETLVGVDGRPQTGQLMGLGVNATANTGTLYLIDPQTAACTAVGTAGQIAYVNGAGNPVDFPDPATVGYGIDFNPTVDRLRVVVGSGLNFRINPNTGAPVDGDLAGAAGTVAGVNIDGSINGSGITGLEAVAYTNAFGQVLTGGFTTQYTLDSVTNQLSIQNPSNLGTQTLSVPVTLAGMPLDLSSRTAFDIPSSVAVTASGTVATGEGWIVTTVGGVTGVYRLDLTTGAATFFGAVGAGATPLTGLVVWATAPDLDVEAPTGTLVSDGAGVVNFSPGALGTTVTRSFRLINRGSQTLTYSTSFDQSSFSVTQGASGTILGSSSTTIDITFANAPGSTRADVLHIASNDGAATASFEVSLSALSDDTVTATSGETRYNPLANDGSGVATGISAVSDPAILIDGRTLIIPSGYTGTFTYTATTTNMGVSQATVTVIAGTPIVSPKSFNGLLFDGDGAIVGWAKAALSTKGSATLLIRGGAESVAAKITIPTGGTSGTVFTKFGFVTLVINANGTATLGLQALGGSIDGTLRAVVTTATAQKHHVALGSVSATYPGGGYAVVTTTAKGAVAMVGLLPDGLPFSAATSQGDNGSITFYSSVLKGPKPPALVGGQLDPADLPTTDVTGELLWAKFPQAATVKGLHLTGVETTLTANGSLFSGTIPLTGPGTLRLSGGNLAAPESAGVTLNAKAIPTVPTGSLKTWTGVVVKVGKFNATVALPGVIKPVKGSGLYLPKSHSAWGFFPGKTVGGRIELTVP